MNTYEIIFWTLLFIIFYTYLGYGIVLIFLVKLKEVFVGRIIVSDDFFEPSVTMFVAAYNEKDFAVFEVEI